MEPMLLRGVAGFVPIKDRPPTYSLAPVASNVSVDALAFVRFGLLGSRRSATRNNAVRWSTSASPVSLGCPHDRHPAPLCREPRISSR
jgi:hypothetical protein